MCRIPLHIIIIHCTIRNAGWNKACLARTKSFLENLSDFWKFGNFKSLQKRLCWSDISLPHLETLLIILGVFCCCSCSFKSLNIRRWEHNESQPLGSQKVSQKWYTYFSLVKSESIMCFNLSLQLRETVPLQNSDIGNKPLSVLAHKVLPHKGLNQYIYSPYPPSGTV